MAVFYKIFARNAMSSSKILKFASQNVVQKVSTNSRYLPLISIGNYTALEFATAVRSHLFDHDFRETSPGLFFNSRGI